MAWKQTVALVAWLVATTVLGGLLLIRHLIALPTPEASDPALREALRADLSAKRWRAVHFMYRSCPCSQKTIAHLLATPRPPDLRELVIIVDDDGRREPDDDRLVARGFSVVAITPGELRARYHLEAAPVLVVMSPDDDIAYVGGYNRHKQSQAYEDIAIVDELRASRSVAALPVFGCATSARLARILDPLDLSQRQGAP